MRTLFRWLFRGTIVFVGLIFLTAAATYILAVRSIPNYDADQRIPGLATDVEIVRDAHAVPHIFATSATDAFFSLGYAHAQDRLWQMVLMRRAAQGRLSELFGSRTIETDVLMRQLAIYDLSVQSLKHQSERTRSALVAYSNGVNAWLDVINREALGRGAPEFFLFGTEVAFWTPADSLALVRLMALRLNTQLHSEISRSLVSFVLDADRVVDILPDSPGKGVTSLPAFPMISPASTNADPTPPGAAAKSGFLMPLPNPGLAGASNAWAAMPKRSVTGAALFAADPHLGLTAPGIWMLARLEFPENSVIGGTIPGIPAILVGRNRHIAWGITSAYVDDLDVYIEKLNPDNPDEYLTEDGFIPFRKASTEIGVGGDEALPLDLYWSKRGPVVHGGLFGLNGIVPENHAATVRWTALDIDDRSMNAAIDLMYARSIGEAREAGKIFRAPALNLIAAEKASIALQTIGALPWRRPDHTSQGRLPSPGWLPQNHWQGYLPYSGHPYVLNPESGIVANTNNGTTNARFPFHLSFDWGDTQRIERLERLLNERRVHTRKSFVDAQLDVVSYTARSLLPLVGRNLWYSDPPGPSRSRLTLRRDALDRLARWNGEMSRHQPTPLIYVAWMRHLQKLLITDELGELADRFSRPSPVFIERVFRDVDGAASWCDIRQSTRVETCDEIAGRALVEAIVELSGKYGQNVEAWRWGTAHVARHDHEVLGEIPVFSWLSNIRIDSSGGENTLQRGGMPWSGDEPYASVLAAGLRVVVDFSDPDNSLYIISTGQSGHPLSRYYDDLAQLWRRGEYITMSLDDSYVRSGAVGVTWLRPIE